MALDCGVCSHGAQWLQVPSVVLVIFIIVSYLHASLMRLPALQTRHLGHTVLEVWVTASSEKTSRSLGWPGTTSCASEWDIWEILTEIHPGSVSLSNGIYNWQLSFFLFLQINR